jgi:hypothetical protein
MIRFMSLKLKRNGDRYIFKKKKEQTKEDLIVKAPIFSVGKHN